MKTTHRLKTEVTETQIHAQILRLVAFAIESGDVSKLLEMADKLDELAAGWK